MKLTMHNTGSSAVPVTGKGWAVILKSSEIQTLDYPDSVWLIGDKANILENIGKSIRVIGDFLLQRKEPAPGETLSVTLTNEGPNAVRIIPGSVKNEFNISPAAVVPLVGIEYIELRELGLAGAEDPTEAP